MEIHLDVAVDGDGRLAGIAQRVGSDDALSFSGTLELLAQVEELCRRGSPDRDGPRQ